MIVINEEFIDPEYFTESGFMRKLAVTISQVVKDKMLKYITPPQNKFTKEQTSAFNKCIKEAQKEINETIDKRIPDNTTSYRAKHYKSWFSTFDFPGYALYQSKKVYVGNRMFSFKSSSDVKAVKAVYDNYEDIVLRYIESKFNKECKDLLKGEKYELGVITLERPVSIDYANQMMKTVIPYIYKKG